MREGRPRKCARNKKGEIQEYVKIKAGHGNATGITHEGSNMTMTFLVWVTMWKTTKLTKTGHREDQSERRGNSLGTGFVYLW